MVTVTKFVIITKLVIFTVQTHLGNKKNITIKQKLINELMDRGATAEEAGKWCYSKNDDIFNQFKLLKNLPNKQHKEIIQENKNN